MQKLTIFQKLRLSFAPQILYRSEDGHIEITDSMENGRPVRLLTYDGIRESGIYLDERSDRDPLFYYMKTLKEISLKYDGLNRALLIGGGGMSFPGYFLNCVPDGQMTSDDGILAINMLNEKPGVVSMQTHLCQAILRQIYRNTSIIICPQKWNCIILASDRKL